MLKSRLFLRFFCQACGRRQPQRMEKLRYLAIVILVLVLVLNACRQDGCPGQASSDSSTSTSNQVKTDTSSTRRSADHGQWEVIDPYCGMKLQRTEAAASMEYKGRIYYFCLRDHMNAFSRDPERYLGSMMVNSHTSSDGYQDADHPASQEVPELKTNPPAKQLSGTKQPQNGGID